MDKPKTIEECMAALGDMLAPADKAEIMKMTKDDLTWLHHGLGQWIRNHWDLWKGGELLEHMKSLGFIHQDDMSQSIIVEYWNRMNNKPSQLQEDIKKYAEYWEKNGNGS